LRQATQGTTFGVMSGPKITAVLGPTNTGKTHLAVERFCGHASGIMGFPLRLLAREVYDRVVGIKGPKEVGLLTGEERIMPPGARWLICTAESMPTNREAAFVAIDEAQLGIDPERGHVFTDRLLHARGYEETMILGSDSVAGLVRKLVPKAEIVRRPRFSTLSYAGAKKLSRLPKRSAIVAFSAEEVYAVAEMLRRARGGAAVVMGALSPRTRNAQVAMFQAGEVDYLVATDAIGMGLNMDVSHVAFAGLTKFDGMRRRRLTVAEMAQIAGRAGRHQRDGTFGSLGGEEAANVFRPEEIEAIEAHRMPRVETLNWRNSELDYGSVADLMASLELGPDRPELRAAPEAVDLAVLKRLADDDIVRDRARGEKMVTRLWAASSLPDFRKAGPEHHSRLVQRVFQHLSEADGHIPAQWVASEIARLDLVDGDIDTIGGRIAAARIWAYAAQRADWLADPALWQRVTAALEEKLSDALHARLTERFVDRRTSVLMKTIGRDLALLDVQLAKDGAVRVEDQLLGHLDGFAFRVDAAAPASDRKQLLAAAERTLGRVRAARAEELLASADSEFGFDGLALHWRGHAVATLSRGKSLTVPRITLERALDSLSEADRQRVLDRLIRWRDEQVARLLAPLIDMAGAAASAETPPRVRAVLAPLAASGGFVAREDVAKAVDALTPEDRQILRRAGLTIGQLDVFDAQLLKAKAQPLLAALLTANGRELLPIAPAGATVSPDMRLGFRRFGAQYVRIDVAEKILRALHDKRAAADFVPDPALATSMGVNAEAFAALLRTAGFRQQGSKWRYRPAKRAEPKPPAPGNRFAALAALAR
jgi:ATP-dependent RNA helicase SUPV3L1/SUV3